MNFWTQEAVTAEMDYRIERAQAGALRELAREARRQRPSLARRLWTRSERTPARRVTPAMP
jgi:hypothetical protein